MNFSFECLDEPVTTKILSDNSEKNVSVGTCMMQGWRTSLQDAYNVCIDYDDNASFFALYDGHGGHEVATYCAKELPDFIQKTYAYSKGDITRALINGISEFDMILTKPEVTEILKELSQVDISKKPENEPNNECESKDEIISNATPEKESKNDSNTSNESTQDDNKESNNLSSNNANQNLNSRSENLESLQECLANGLEKKLESLKLVDTINNPEKIEDKVSPSKIEFIKESSEKSIEDDNCESNEEDVDYDDDEEDDDEDDDDDDEDDDGIGLKSVKDSDDEDDNYQVRRDFLDRGSILDLKNNFNDTDEDLDKYDDFYYEDDDEYIASTNKQPGYKNGCTAIVVILSEGTLYVGNTGDSRCVICRDGKALDLSEDLVPFMKPEYERLKAGRKITFPGQVYRKLKLARTLGDHRFKRNPLFPFAHPIVNALPNVTSHVIDPKQQVTFAVIASNGVWKYMSSKKVIKFVNERINSTNKLSKICEELLDHCVEMSHERPEPYNLSVILIKFEQANKITSESMKISKIDVLNKLNNLKLTLANLSITKHCNKNIETN
ncbi:hypothetical protein PV327_003275 [Microctonus hyperodae]|uniref:protein-serine/threonine phosphatase n=1 Tax=Microctonus hyperodae TaxID=165561 RepID=A0AA39G3N8_MICHY|nr:hypothetical protein PV327_003275 [Microctonus hyperodae]